MEGLQARAWRAFGFALITVWFTGYLAVSSPSSAQAAEWTGKTVPASSTLSEVYFSAQFRWNGGLSKNGFRLGPDRENPQSIRAEILDSEGKTQALCQMVRFTKDSTTEPVAMDLKCRSGSLSFLHTTVSLLWNGAKTPSLRFGSWLSGYKKVALDVTTDRYAHPESPRGLATPALVKADLPQNQFWR